MLDSSNFGLPRYLRLSVECTLATMMVGHLVARHAHQPEEAGWTVEEVAVDNFSSIYIPPQIRPSFVFDLLHWQALLEVWQRNVLRYWLSLPKVNMLSNT